MYWQLGELGQLPLADSSGNNRTGTYRNGLTYGVPGALPDTTTGVQSPGTSGVAYTNQQVTNPQVYSLEVFLKTSSGGGKILGLENAQTGWGTTYDRQLYMSGGRITYGILAGGVQRVITSTDTYNDDEFHHVVATQGAAGMALYIDGALVGSNPTVAPDAANGYWRLGGGNVTGWPNAPGSSALGGTYDEVAVYPTALTAARVLAHYTASGQTGTPAPAAPTNVRTTSVTGTTADLAWDAPAGTITGYKVFRDGVLRGSPTNPQFSDTGLVSGQVYSYTVTATSAAGESVPSNPLLVTTPAPGDGTPPSVPQNLHTTSVSGTSVSLAWNASTDNVGVSGYIVTRNGVDLPITAATTLTDTTVVANQTYSYTVSARDAAGNLSAASAALPVTASDPDPSSFSDQFSGPDGSGWGVQWTTSVADGTATLVSGTGELALTDTAGAYSRALLSGLATRTNSETLFSYHFNTTARVAYFSVYARGSGGWQNGYRPRNGYGLEMKPQSGTVEVIRNDNGTTATLAMVTGARQVSTAKQWIRLRVSGTTIQFRSWVDGQPEPATWTSTVTDSTVTAAGQLHFSLVRGGSNTGVKSVQIDDLSVVDG